MSNQSTTQSSQANFTSSSTFSSQKPTYAPSIQSTTSSFQSYKPLLDTESPSSTSTSTPSKNSKAWKKTKKFLSSLGEPPTAEYDRQQDAKKGIKTNGREAFGAINYGPYRTKSRLPTGMLGAVDLPVGMFAFAWKNFPDVYWSVSIILSTPFGFGVALIFMPCLNYLLDAYTIYAASVLAAGAMLRSLFGAAFPMFTAQIYANPGIHWASSVPAFSRRGLLAISFCDA
ncbi:hypothetical protein BKA61DRAFT_664130 [Leptodontidium sp. MPI-SDFR-AT-0119]|nr:hypothetical protein BKA61DRAFT_664130 [Leptodontidium sp. MPI-SDFR-AT-0119]